MIQHRCLNVVIAGVAILGAGCSGSTASSPTTATSTAVATTLGSAASTSEAATTTTSTQPLIVRTPVAVTGPVTGGKKQANAATIDLAAFGYSESEFFINGNATSYTASGALGSDGKWNVVSGKSAPFTTRIVVRRPTAVKFSGTVLIEWLNVSAGADGEPDWGYTSGEILREGHVWVGVSAQAVGVNGGKPIIPGTPAGGGLVKDDPERYGTLAHPGDSFAYDMFTQAATALVSHSGVAPLGDLIPKKLIAVGESQSAFFLTTYINAVQPLSKLFDGFLVHSRGGGASSIDGAPVGPVKTSADAVKIRDDIAVPVLMFETETDLTVLGYAKAQQRDTPLLKVWEVAGTAHADAYLLVEVYHLGESANLSSLVNCPAPLNSGPQHEVLQAALHHLTTWVAGGAPPPSSARFEVASVDPPTLSRDNRGIAIGGIRTPLVDVPVAALSGDLVAGAAGFCVLFGSTTPFDSATLKSMYPTPKAYVDAFETSLKSAVAAGFVLEADAAKLLQHANSVALTLTP